MLKLGLILSMCFVLLTCSAQNKPKQYEATETEHLKLQIKQKDAQIAQIYYTQSQQKYNEALQELYRECTAIRDNHEWPETVTCKPEDLTFFDIPKKVEPKK